MAGTEIEKEPVVRTTARRGSRGGKERPTGLALSRYFTTPGVDPADEIAWEQRTASITDESGKPIFEQKDVEVPKYWSALATNVVASKYFRGAVGPTRERSVKQLVGRVVRTISRWGREEGYFASEPDAQTFEAELAHLLYRQKMSFNSPVWFNVGVEDHPQCSACFINSVEDSMGSILDLAKTEGMLFKYGSGTGTNLSPVRSSKETLAGGGTASGPVSFMKGFDAFAGVIKSGGKTRRAAKMVILNADHPDIQDFIQCKSREEKKAWALIEAGYESSFNGEAYSSVFFQNSNNSVRVTDELMRAVVLDGDWNTRAVLDGRTMETFRARELFKEIAEAAWLCGDPGLQYDTTVNAWHTCPRTARINASNPCVTGDTLVATSRGLKRIDTLLDQPAEVLGGDGELHPIEPAFPTGVKPVYRLRTRAGLELKLTADHRVLTRNRGDVPACELSLDDVLVLGRPRFGADAINERLGEFLGLVAGEGRRTGSAATLSLQPGQEELARRLCDSLTAFQRSRATDARSAPDVEVGRVRGVTRLSTDAACVVDELDRLVVVDREGATTAFRDAVYGLDQASTAALLRGLFTANATLVPDPAGEPHHVSLENGSLLLLQQVQQLLLGFGIKSRLLPERRPLGQSMALVSDGKGGRREVAVDQVHALRVSRSSRVRFERLVGFVAGSPKAAHLAELEAPAAPFEDRLEDRLESLEFIGEEPVFDLTEPATDHFVAGGLVVHNCSEYMFLDDTACNLASLNLMHFRTVEGDFDVEAFRHAVEITILAQEILVGKARYPTPRIEENSHKFRPLGLGFANLGALLMSRGVPYDSDEGRAYAGAITAMMCGYGYTMSARIARDHGGPFEGFALNREPFLGVMRKHRKAVDDVVAPRLVGDRLTEAARGAWDEAIALGSAHGYRNAQATVLAPTGTIAFMMDCDTTGIEPDIALIKYKKLVGGGMLKIVNNTVPAALSRLGYEDKAVQQIVHYLDESETIEGAPGLRDEHLPVFDCAFKPSGGSRSIHWMGHIKMMAACQPFLSGAISKTVNLPTDATVTDIEHAYMESWKLGLKAVAVYRDGCKRSQPLNTSRDAEKLVKEAGQFAQRRKLADERAAITHKFSIGGHEGYLTVGLYEDRQPGELFVVMAKEGSVVSGLMDSFATAISLALQYGVPLRVLCDKFSHTRFEPSGFTGNPAIPIAKSITDYIFRWLAHKFLPAEEGEAGEGDAAVPPQVKTMPVTEVAQSKSGPPSPARSGSGAMALPGETLAPMLTSSFLNQQDAPPCHTCGSITVRNGACYKCLNCGATNGCS